MTLQGAPRGWPATLQAGRVGLRPITRHDRAAWLEVRSRNAAWLAPWEATPPRDGGRVLTFAQMVRSLRAQARRARCCRSWSSTTTGWWARSPSAASRGARSRSAHVGYWVDQRVAGRGVMPTAVALVTDHCFGTVGLHRLEVNIRPENAASLRVVEKLGFREEGTREAFLHIDGAWRDHRSFALTAGEVPEGMLARWRAAQQQNDR